jgi:photosystem II stability/assembly factor-like uncharacterized protein
MTGRFPIRGTIALIAMLIVAVTNAQDETLYMSVLSSQKHQWDNIDNPVIGIFRSGDAGDTWEHIGWRGYIRTFYTEVGPDGTIWAACGNGALRSVDNGGSFTVTTGWEITEVLKVRVDPVDPETVYAATAYGVFKTADRGTTWSETNVGLPALPFTSDLLIDRNDTRTLYAATEDGIYLSRESGETWNRIGLRGKGIRVITQHPENGSILYAGTEDDGIYQSNDGGSSWVQKNRGLDHRTVYAIVIDHKEPEILYAGTHGGGVYRSHDGGDSWEQAADGLTTPDVHSLALLPSDTSVLFAGTLNGGLFRTTNRGDSWEHNGQEGGQVWGLSIR